MSEKAKILTLCSKGECCPTVERIDENTLRFKFDDETNTMTLEQFRVLLDRYTEIIG